jgi:SulP family sulfate permease
VNARGTALLPGRRDYAELPRSWRHDLLAGLTVAIVALPLALGFGVASGIGAQAGLVTAIVAGIVAAAFGGSHLQVSGPTGAMTVVLIPVVAQVGPHGIVVVALLAGLLLIAAGALRLGRYVHLLPWPVVEGFTIGIGLLIFLQQVPNALGVAPPDDHNTAVAAVTALVDWGGGQWASLAVVAAVAAIMVVAPRIHRALPGSLLAIAVVTVAVSVVGGTVEPIGAIPGTLPAPSLPHFEPADLGTLLTAAIAVAALAAIESLLSAKVADGMSDGVPRHDPDRELVGQGAANVAVAVFGGMPATGAIARTAVNVRSGARTRVAAISHGLVLIGVVVALAPLLGEVPLAALAGVLMVTAVRMIDHRAALRIVRSSRSDALLLAVTAFATLAFDLVVAVVVGVVIAALLALRTVAAATRFDRAHPDDASVTDERLNHALRSERIVTFRLDGALFFGAAHRLLDEVTRVRDVETVILRLRALEVLDSTGAQTLRDLIDELEARGVTVLIACARPEHEALLRRVGTIDALAHENHLVPTIDDALIHARRHLDRNDSRREPAAAIDGDVRGD